MTQVRLGRWGVPVLLAAIAGAYYNSFSGAMVFDDYRVLLPLVQGSSIPWSELLFQTSRPLVYVSFALNYLVGGEQVWSYHAVNLAIHAGAAVLLYLVLRRLLHAAGAAASATLALVASLVWAVHPVQTESVTYLVQRAESLAGLGVLACMYASLRAAEAHGRGWAAAAVAACALAMATKPVAVIAPVAVVLMDRAFLFPSFAEAWRARWRLYAGLAATWLLLAATLIMGRVDYAETAGAVPSMPWWRYAATQPGVILHYLRLAVWPRALVIDYGWPLARQMQDILPQALLLAALAAATAWAWRQRPAWGFLGVWWWLTLSPSSSVIPIMDVAVEHRLYLPLASIAVLAAFATQAAATRARAPWLGVAVAAAVVLALGARTVRRNEDYASPARLWREALLARPDNPRAHYNLGTILGSYGAWEAAIRHFNQAVELEQQWAGPGVPAGERLASFGGHPMQAQTHSAIGWILARQGRTTEALPHLRRAVELMPKDAEKRNNFGNGLLLAGQPAEAQTQFREALRLRPRFAEAANGLGVALLRLGRRDDAIASFQRAIALRPSATYDRNLHIALERRPAP